MTQPLSPLSPSIGNSRTQQSPAYVPPSTVRRRRRGTDHDDKENASPKPPKRALYSYDGGVDDDDVFNIDDDRDHDIYDMTLDLNDGPPSSPFRADARDDTVDMNRLLAMTTATPSVSGRTTMSPEKKTGPEIYVDEENRQFDEIDADKEVELDRTYKTAAPQTTYELDSVTAPSDNGDMNDDGDNNDSVVYHESKQVSNSIMEDRHHEEMSTVAHMHSSEENSMDSQHTEVFFAKRREIHENDSMDDTCFSTFSAVPNVDMTLFAKLGASPTKKIGDITPPTGSRTPGYTRRSKVSTPGTIHRRRDMEDLETSPTPRRKSRAGNDDSINLLDFNDSVSYFHRVSQRFSMTGGRASLSPRRRSPLKPRESLRSPGKYNLIDFDMPPPATPMSIPSITPHELESLKSGFLSEISSLKATLSGKEAEVSSLKQAVADAERRVGEALEEVRNEAIRKEALEVEQAEWERRGKEMETVLRDVRAEIIDGECERERLTKKNDEAERLKEQLEGKIVELESQLDAANKTAAMNATASSAESAEYANKQGNMVTVEQSAKEVQEAVERVARELHTLYKSKHETKVAALKKSYESRWEKRVREGENKLREATEEIERLKTERDATMSGPLNPNMSVMSVMGRDNEELETENKVLGAQIKGLEEQLATIKRDNEELHAELKNERTEKGELVAAVDEWLAVQQVNSAQTQSASTSTTTTISATPLHITTSSREVSASSVYYSASEQDASASIDNKSNHNNNVSRKKTTTPDEQLPADLQPQPQPQSTFKRSISRGGNTSGVSSSTSGSTLSGLRPPSSGTSATPGSGLEKRSRLGMYGAGHARHNSGGNRSIAMPSTTPGRSGIMGSIERMGAGGR